jgi:hypothetical protein
VRDRRQRQIVLAFEVMEKAALGDARLTANIVDRRGCVAFGADRIQRRVQEFGLRFMVRLGCHFERVPTSRYDVNPSLECYKPSMRSKGCASFIPGLA